MRRSLLVIAVPAALLLSACGGSDTGASPSTTGATAGSTSQAVTTTARSSAVASSTAATSGSRTSTSAASSSPTSTSAVSAAGGGSGATPGTAVIKAGAGAALPAKVGAWNGPSSPSGPGTIYTQGNSTVIVSFLTGSSFDGVASNVSEQQTATSAGICGSTSVASNLTCYLRTADGVLNLSADAGDTPLPQLVGFADELTTTLGTS